MTYPYGVISYVELGGPAYRAGIRKGDRIAGINGEAVRDVIDVRFHSAEQHLNIVVLRRGRELMLHVDKDYDDLLGVDFTQELFDGVKVCRNHCLFCFVDNLPRGMRRPLYLKDDDYRLSFLHGNFVTLSNLSADDMRRILDQRLSPLYVSVHSTQPELRSKLLKPRDCPDIMPMLKTLADGGISFHTQIVVCPGLNDGEHLNQTIADLAALRPAVLSIGVVPVGLTKYAKAPLRPFTKAEARTVLRQVAQWQRRFRSETRERLVFASDELYLLAGRSIPCASAYEGYPQYENGIGIVRSFLDDLRKIARNLPQRIEKRLDVGIVTSVGAEPFLGSLADTLNSIQNVSVNVYPVANDFFGHKVTVAGLLTGQDVIARLTGLDLPRLIIVPRVMLRDNRFLDDVSLEDLAKALQRPVAPVESSPIAFTEEIGLAV